MKITLGKRTHFSPVGSNFRFSPMRRVGRGFRKDFDFRKKRADWNYRGVRFSFEWEQGIRLAVDFNTGAGYIGGATAFVAFWCKGSSGVDMYHRIPLQAGVTKNANIIPHPY